MGQERWTVEQVLELAPDPSSVAAGRKLSAPAPWSGTGASAGAVWGECKGSGKKPYQTVVDLGAPAFKCSCPSRKFPCKHAIGLLLLWSAGSVPESTDRPDFAATWLDGRAERAERATTAPSADPERAAATARRRAERVRAGVDELAVWISDQIEHGLAGADRDPYARFDPVAARLVDAQAPGLAARIRKLPGIITGADWPDRLLSELATTWALTVAHRNIDDLAPAMAANVRRHVGYTVAKHDVLATQAVDDDWLVIGRSDAVEDALQSRRTWLRGRRTGRFALLADFAPTGGVLPARPVTGMSFETGLHFYPGQPAYRALYDSEIEATRMHNVDVTGVDITAARVARSAALALDPWLRAVPVLVTGRAARIGDRPALRDDHGVAVPLVVAPEEWLTLVAIGRGRSIGVFGELLDDGLAARSIVHEGTVSAL